MQNLIKTSIKENVISLREKRPLIVNLTNDVTMDFIANGLLALGASPIMTKSIEELYDLVKISNAVVINIGTLNAEFVKISNKAAQIANDLGKLLILDPVGSGASEYRTEVSRSLINKYKFDIIKGNASEILSLIDDAKNAQGVDSSTNTAHVIAKAHILSQKLNNIIAISGKVDAIIKNDKTIYVDKGSALMPTITGSGCLLTAVIAAFAATNDDKFNATCNAFEYYNNAAESCEHKSVGPGSFKVNFLDEIAK